MKILRPYQTTIAKAVLEHLVEGQQDIIVGMPPGSGKTSTLQFVAASHREMRVAFTTFLVVVPGLDLVGQWGVQTEDNLKKRREIPSFRMEKGLEAFFQAESATSSVMADPHFWTSKTPRILVVTRQALITPKVQETLRKLPRGACKRVMVISDEGHHHVQGEKGTSCGNTTKRIRDLGGTEIRLSGTPWHAKADMRNEKTVVVPLSAGFYARQVDEKGLPYAPSEWVPTRVPVDVEAKSLRQVCEGADNSKAEKDAKLGGAYRTIYIDTMIRRWVDEGCPKTIFKLPRTDWGPLFQETLENSRKAEKILGRKPRVLNLVGKPSPEVRINNASTLAREADEETTYKTSQVDALLACSRADEGLDWRLCSHVYCVRIPSSPRLLLQLWFRAGRGKHGIVGYPAKWKEKQVIRFFVPERISEQIQEKVWKEHRDLALLLACYLEDHDTADKWVGDPPAFTKAVKMKPGSRGYEAAQKEAIAELKELGKAGDDFDIARAKGELRARIAAAPEGELSMESLRKWIAGNRKLSAHQKASYNQALDDILKKQEKKVRRAMRKNGGIIRPDKYPEWEAAISQFDHIMLSNPSEFYETMARFVAWDTEKVALALKDGGDFPWSVEIIRAEAEKYKSIHGEWPTTLCGPCKGFWGRSWPAADRWLREYQNTTLSEVTHSWGGMAPWSLGKILREAEIYLKKNGKHPTQTSGAWDGFGGRHWSAADRWLREHQHTTLSQLLRGKPFEWSFEKIRREVQKFVNIRGRLPRQGDGPWEGFGGLSWRKADRWLTKYHQSSLLKFLQELL